MVVGRIVVRVCIDLVAGFCPVVPRLVFLSGGVEGKDGDVAVINIADGVGGGVLQGRGCVLGMRS